MNREIKFRAKAYSDDWVYGNLIHSKRFEGYSNEWRIHDCETGLESDVIPETVGQFTGLYSENADYIREPNKETYFGDIIRFCNTEGREFIKELSWNDKLCCIMVGNLPYKTLYESGYIQPSKLLFEIIGNIHDDPELLKTTDMETTKKECKTKILHTCPVCFGRGFVPNGFYSSIGTDRWLSTSIIPEECRSCNGTGIIFTEIY